MPEIIDLQVISENINRAAGGQTLRTIDILSQKVLRNVEQLDLKDSLEKKKLKEVVRVGKFLSFEFANGAKLIVHLMLNGNMCWGGADQKRQNVVCEMDFGPKIIWVKDWSRWAVIELDDPRKSIESKLYHAKHGVEPFSEDFTEDTFCKILVRNPRQNIKALLMNQHLIAGIGNAYADESLFEARIHPFSRAKSIFDANLCGQLWLAINKVLKHSLDVVRKLSKGTSIVEQDRNFMKVYRKDGQSCPTCKGKIIKTRTAGRDTFVCKSCQKLYY